MILRRFVKIFAVITSLGAYLMVFLGVLVTNTGSGRGCGNSWPFCHGEIIPGTLTIQGVTEYSHRISAGLDTMLVAILVVGALWLYHKDFRIKLFSGLSVLFVLLQAALGALTVMYEGKWELAWLLSVHFGLSLIAFTGIVLLTVRIFQIDNPEPAPNRSGLLPKLQWPVLGLIIYTYLVVYSGALVDHTGAVAACGYQLLGCGSTILPGISTLAGIQVLHRYAAGLLYLLTLALLVLVARRYRERRDVYVAAWWAFILINLQALTGALNVLTIGQLLPVIAHTTLITIFFTILSYICMQIGWPGSKERVILASVGPEKSGGSEIAPAKA